MWNRLDQPSLLWRFWKFILWFWDYLYAFATINMWILTKELRLSNLGLNLNDFSDRKGQVAIVTGGTGGIGSNVIKKLLKLDMHVILGCRNQTNCNNLLAELRKSRCVSGTLESMSLDLESFDSVRNFVLALQRRKLEINILINNAGIFAVPFRITDDGFESQFQVNYLSHFLLTNLLIPNLIETAEKTGIHGRVVFVSSCLQYYSRVKFDDLELRKRYNPYIAYFNSKWMEAMMARYLDRVLQGEKSKVRINALHPGCIPTNLASHIPFVSHPLSKWFMKRILSDVEAGGDEVLYVALSRRTEKTGGEFYVRRKPFEVPNDSRENQGKLWKISCKLTGIPNEYE